MQVGKAFGVRILLDKFFLFLLVVYGVLGLLPQALTVFGVVFIHEVAHTLVARSYGYRVKEIELLPFGGVARIEDIDLVALDPAAEINIALAGPLQNLLLAGVGAFLKHMGIWQEPLVSFFIQCNLGIIVLNLLPVLPLDGGRIMRAQLARKLGLKQATERITSWGRGAGLLLALTGLVGIWLNVANITLFLVAIFVYMAASRERTAAAFIFMRFLTRKEEELRDKGVLPVEGLMATGSTTLREVVRRFVPKRYHLVVIREGKGDSLGVLTEREIVNALLEKGLDTPLRSLLKQD